MAKRQAGPTMFDVLEEQDTIKNGTCTHPRMKPTITVWPGETHSRFTMTCEICGFYRGRWPGEEKNR